MFLAMEIRLICRKDDENSKKKFKFDVFMTTLVSSFANSMVLISLMDTIPTLNYHINSPLFSSAPMHDSVQLSLPQQLNNFQPSPHPLSCH